MIFVSRTVHFGREPEVGGGATSRGMRENKARTRDPWSRRQCRQTLWMWSLEIEDRRAGGRAGGSHSDELDIRA